MQIDFYEEFPTKNNLERLKLIEFKSRLFIAAKSLCNFYIAEKKAKKINRKISCVYWPIIKDSYWISPFSRTKDLKNLFLELNRTKKYLLIDLEPPLDKKMIIKNLFNFGKNKRRIKQFLEKNKRRITTAQYPFLNLQKLMMFIGLDYDVNTEKSLMWYSSILSPQMNRLIKKMFLKIKDKQNYSISLGTITKGIFGNEIILSPEALEENLIFLKEAGFNKAVIFRLGGLSKKYIEVISKFV